MNTKVVHYGEVYRHEKINALEEPLRRGEITLRVCYKPILDGWNCNICEKCARIICFLIALGIDPNTCGFEVDDKTLERVKVSFKKNYGWKGRMKFHWLSWINSLTGEVPDKFKLREFIEWLRELEI